MKNDWAHGNGFSAANASQNEAKLGYVKLNIQTPCPPRSAVPVNQGRTWEAFALCSFRIELRSWMRPPSYGKGIFGDCAMRRQSNFNA
jgi:pectin methylesterase-like acyl-CoA thioesterase